MAHTILIVDDEESIRTSLRGILEDENFLVAEADNGAAALERLRQGGISAVLLDIWMAGMDGLETLKRFKESERDSFPDPEVPIIMMSGHGTIDTAVSATKMGAYDFLEKPLSLDRVLLLLERATRQWELVRENRALKAAQQRQPEMVGDSAALTQVRRQVERVAPTGGWVLVIGENGTGKEVAARLIHSLSRRSEGPFIPVNAAAMPRDLVETELFGLESPAGATPVTGRFEQAHGGTLFLDEIADMPLEVQARILSILQEGRFRRMGGGTVSGCGCARHRRHQSQPAPTD
ncbi:MAG: sigma-54 dependent transcriptional regulator [Magnetococcus sp. WYHC-3]